MFKKIFLIFGLIFIATALNAETNQKKQVQTQEISDKVEDNKYDTVNIPDRRGTGDFREAIDETKGYDHVVSGVKNGVYKAGSKGVTGVYTVPSNTKGHYQVQIGIGTSSNGGPENAAKMAKNITQAYANLLKLYEMDNSVETLNDKLDDFDIDGNGVLILTELGKFFLKIRKEYGMPEAKGKEFSNYLKKKVNQKNTYQINKTDNGYVGKLKIGDDDYMKIFGDTKQEVRDYLDKYNK